MTQDKEMIFRMATFEQKLDRHEDKLDRFIEVNEERHRDNVRKLDRLLEESNEWRGVRKGLAYIGAVLVGFGTIVGVFFTWFFGHKGPL